MLELLQGVNVRALTRGSMLELLQGVNVRALLALCNIHNY